MTLDGIEEKKLSHTVKNNVSQALDSHRHIQPAIHLDQATQQTNRVNTPSNFTTSNPIVNTLIVQNNQLKLNLQKQQQIRAERDALLAELSVAR